MCGSRDRGEIRKLASVAYGASGLEGVSVSQKGSHVTM